MNFENYQRVAQGEPAQLLLSDRALFKLSGTDRVRYLNGQITNDVTKLLPGGSLYGAVLTGKGKIISDLFVSTDGETLWIDTPLPLKSAAHQRLAKFLIADDAFLEEVTDDYTLIHVLASSDLKLKPAPANPPSTPTLFRNPRFGPPGFDLWVEKNQSSGLDDIPILDPAFAEIFQIESALGKWGAEIDENTLPQEILMERHGLSYEKGCYVGQETVARIRSIGHVNRQLAFVELMAGPLPTLPASLKSDSAEAGKLTSLAYSPLLQKTVGLGLVSRKFNLPGGELSSGESRFKIASAPRAV
jgi:folate-binding protein YgfZ